MTRSHPPSTYDDDFFAWTQEQAAALREMPSAAVGSRVDIAHVAEEIEDLGKRDLRDVTSFLARLFEHLLKIESCPTSLDVPNWREVAHHFQESALDAFSPSMRGAIDLGTIWPKSRKRTRRLSEDVGIPVTAPADCPFTLDELFSEDFDLDLALAKLAAATVEARRDVP